MTTKPGRFLFVSNPMKNSNDHRLYPLNTFYRQLSHPIPRFETVDPSQIPQPQRQLLAHTNDMTPTLAAFYRQTIGLRVLKKTIRPDDFMRLVVLECPDGRAILFGAIHIHLLRFTPEIRQHILACRQPLGTILEMHPLPHRSEPQFYFRLQSDAMMNDIFGLPQSKQLYGRFNHLINTADEPLVEVVEILP